MSKISKQILEVTEAARKLALAYDVWTKAESDLKNWSNREDEFPSCGGSRVDFDFREGRLSEAEEEASEDFENAMDALKKAVCSQ